MENNENENTPERAQASEQINAVIRSLQARSITGYRIYDPINNKMVYSGRTPSMLSQFFKDTAILNTKHDMPYMIEKPDKDIDGNSVYEGDIILTQELRTRNFSDKAKRKRFMAIVKYIHFDNGYQDSFWYAQLTEDEGKYRYCNWGYFFRCKVLGNIFENPELLV